MNAIELSGWRGGERVTLPVDEDEYLAELDIRRAGSRRKEVLNETVVDKQGTY